MKELLVWLIAVVLKYIVGAWVIYKVGTWLYKRQRHARNARRKFAMTRQHLKEISDSLANFTLEPSIETLLPKATIKQMHELLLAKKVTCVELVKFFTKRSGQLNGDLNLICDFFYEDAIALAQQRDVEIQTYISEKKPLPPLFGIPISLKDVIDYKGKC